MLQRPKQGFFYLRKRFVSFGICISLAVFVSSSFRPHSLERFGPVTLRARDGETCGVDKFRFPFGKQLANITDALAEEDVQVIAKLRHADYQKRFSFNFEPSGESFSKICEALNPNVWIECSDSYKQKEQIVSTVRKQARFCTSNSYIIELPCMFVETWGAVHEAVPGALFDVNRAFIHQHYVRGPQTGVIPRVLSHHKRLAIALYPYLGASGHFPHETLPKVLWLLQTLPDDVPVLAPVTPWTLRYYHALAAQGINTSRIIPFHAVSNSMLTAERLYTVIEWPFCRQDGNPNHGGEPSEFPYEIMSSLRAVIVPQALKSSPAKTILIIDRGEDARKYVRHAQLVEKLSGSQRIHGFNIEVFSPSMLNKPLSDHIAIFSRAAVVVGPHGAGFSNLIFCREGTAVIEIGYDSPEVLQFDEMYFQLSLGLHLRYWLVLGQGSYVDTIDANEDDIISIVYDALER
jgi:hypothetical protein